MTLIAALHGTDGLVIGSDSRGTIGDPRGLTAINDSQVKLLQLSPYVGVATAGQAELANQLLAECQTQGFPQPFVDDVMVRFRDIVRSRYHDWFQALAPERRPSVSFLMAGLSGDHPKSGGKIFFLSSDLDFAPQYTPNGFMLAGVPQYAIYLLHRLYSPGMSRKHLVALAAYVISETATQDPKVGGPIRLAEIVPGKGYSEVVPETITQVMKRNEEQNLNLRKFFFGGDANGGG